MIPPFKSIYAGQEQNEKGINGNYFKHYISHILATTSTKKISDLKNTTTMLTATMSTTITKYHLQRCWYNRHFSHHLYLPTTHYHHFYYHYDNHQLCFFHTTTTILHCGNLYIQLLPQPLSILQFHNFHRTKYYPHTLTCLWTWHNIVDSKKTKVASRDEPIMPR